MNFKKTASIAAAVAALAAVSVPAMAFENEIHGFYQIKGFLSNFNDGSAKDWSATSADRQLGKKANDFVEQRARLFYSAKASDDLKLVTAVELDTRFGGITDGKYATTSDSGVLDADGVMIETKWVYLDFNATKNVNVKTGVMPYKDSIKGLFVDADVPAIYTTTKFDALTLGLGFSRFGATSAATVSTAGVVTNTLDSGGTPTTNLGHQTQDLYILDAKYEVSKDLKAGLSYYGFRDATVATSHLVVHTLGLNADANVGPANVSGFVAFQAGQKDNITGPANRKIGAYALNVAAKLPVASGTAKAAILYTSGDRATDTTKERGWIGSGVQSYNESGLMLLVRNNVTSGTTTTNEFIKRTITDVGLLTVGYDAKIDAKTYANVALGLGWAPERTTAQKGSYIGTELAAEAGYKVYDNLTASVQLAYLIAGDYMKSPAAGAVTPENPYTTRLVLTYAF